MITYNTTALGPELFRPFSSNLSYYILMSLGNAPLTVNEITETVSRQTKHKVHQSAVSREIRRLKEEKLVESVRINGKLKQQLNKTRLFEHLGHISNLMAYLIDDKSTLMWGKLNMKDFTFEGRPVSNKRFEF